MRGIKRLLIKNEITDKLLQLPYLSLSGGLFTLKFLESVDLGTWEEYYVLLEIKKIEESPEYLAEVFKSMKMFMNELHKELPEITSLGIQDMDCGLSNYYILFYIIKNKL